MFLTLDIHPAPSAFVARQATFAAEAALASAGALLPDLAAAIRLGAAPPILDLAARAATDVLLRSGHEGAVTLVLHDAGR